MSILYLLIAGVQAAHLRSLIDYTARIPPSPLSAGAVGDFDGPVFEDDSFPELVDLYETSSYQNYRLLYISLSQLGIAAAHSFSAGLVWDKLSGAPALLGTFIAYVAIDLMSEFASNGLSGVPEEECREYSKDLVMKSLLVTSWDLIALGRTFPLLPRVAVLHAVSTACLRSSGPWDSAMFRRAVKAQLARVWSHPRWAAVVAFLHKTFRAKP